MDWAVTEEQRELAAVVRRMLADHAPDAAVRDLMSGPDGHDPALWSLMAELGLQGLAVPEEHGGAGCGLAELAVVLEELGRRLLPSPFLPSAVLAVQTLLAADDPAAAAAYLPGLADGSLIATVALPMGDTAPAAEIEATSADDSSYAASQARSSEAGGADAARTGEFGGFRLTGVADLVLEAQVADLVLLSARTAAGPSLFAVRTDAPGVTVTQLPTLDQTRRLARVALDAAPAAPIGVEGGAPRVLARVLDLAEIALSAEALGGAQHCLDSSVAYAKVRHQFGKPIGSFQAIKHKCADLLTLVESARSAVAYAAGTADTASPDALPVTASLAKSHTADAYFTAAAESIQIHGGLGFTWEHDAHLHFKRAKSTQLLFSTPTTHRTRLAAHLSL
ncbi:acyl-CoA dehydrogenase family protein [Actinocorallia sp. A-T 12471]|uniref:acyl-CoA dehydrogenase family protein n=1 Tax=Actinocorallia sp. A-T 12471 TaxID=3089813 RepID=UPI0029D22924|nr:acyl-CoA dehydrogenase family protein [Actinocorallia sp. A-T 12471]MDX6739354.1 acyl-CoA dehydrogenase family protein [Actinocorallia sp. A-T 12471]